MHPLTKPLRLPKIVYVLTKKTNLLLGASILTKNLPHVLLLVFSKNKVGPVARRGIRPGSLAPAGQALKVPSTLIVPNYTRDDDARGLTIKNTQVLRKNFKKKIKKK